MARSKFYPFRNSVLVFEVEDLSSDELDKSGNPTPSKKNIKIEAFLKPVKSNRLSYKDYPNLGTSEEVLEGYIVSPDNGFPSGVAVLNKTVKATYRDVDGIFTRLISLPSSVKAEKITGYPIKGIFKIL